MTVLVIGGSGSGKSAYAERLALKLAGQAPRYYLATMQVWDDECKARIRRHRAQRAGRGFETWEQPQNLQSLPSNALDKSGTILLEDLGNLAANELYSPGPDPLSARQNILGGLCYLRGHCRHLVVVSNEVCVGGTEYRGETDRYLRLLGRLHQEIARTADAVCEVTGGLPFYYKGGEP